jgi:very-short-patch-repair endonuclease
MMHGLKGRPKSEEHKRHLSEALTGSHLSEETKAKISEINSGKVRTTAQKENYSEAAKVRWRSKEYRAKFKNTQSLSMKQVWKNYSDEKKNRILSGWRRGSHIRTTIELSVESELVSLGEVYKSQVVIGSWCVDFLLPERRLIIECDGDYWHQFNKARDRKKDKELKAMGYIVKRLTEKQIRADVKTCVEKAVRSS